MLFNYIRVLTGSSPVAMRFLIQMQLFRRFYSLLWRTLVGWIRQVTMGPANKVTDTPGHDILAGRQVA